MLSLTKNNQARFPRQLHLKIFSWDEVLLKSLFPVTLLQRYLRLIKVNQEESFNGTTANTFFGVNCAEMSKGAFRFVKWISISINSIQIRFDCCSRDNRRHQRLLLREKVEHEELPRLIQTSCRVIFVLIVQISFSTNSTLEWFKFEIQNSILEGEITEQSCADHFARPVWNRSLYTQKWKNTWIAARATLSLCLQDSFKDTEGEFRLFFRFFETCFRR